MSRTQLWEELAIARTPNAEQLERMRLMLSWLWLALGSLAPISAALVESTLKANSLAPEIARGFQAWEFLPSGDDENSQGREFELEAARASVVSLCDLARQQRESLREMVTLVERQETPTPGSRLHSYREEFHRRVEQMHRTASTELSDRLLVDLLFCSTPKGYTHLWSVLRQL